jgi:mannose-1-phosphate guanylyltransferase
MTHQNNMKAIIFCGGTGTRMWPMSRDKSPKQFQKLIGDQTIFQETINRILKVCTISDVFISTQKEYEQEILTELPDLPKENLIFEPEKRDTLACVGYAVAKVNQKFPNTIVFSTWSDLYVRNVDEFIRALFAAQKIVEEKNVIVNIDAKPTFPNVSLGYMEIGQKQVLDIDGFQVFQLVRQIEKPHLAEAKEYVRSFKYLWHTGFAVFRTGLFLELYKKYAPEAYDAYQKMITLDFDDENALIEYKKIPKLSVDFGIFEKIQEGGILEIPADLGFSDIGLWGVLKDEISERGKDLVIKGKNYDEGSIDCLIYELNDEKIVATIGLENLIIVDTPDALLVCSKFKSQDVKKIVERLKNEGKDKYL